MAAYYVGTGPTSLPVDHTCGGVNEKLVEFVHSESFATMSSTRRDIAGVTLAVAH